MHFNVGDKVRRRRDAIGVIGALDATGTVLGIEMRGGYEIVIVLFPDRMECFNWDVYEPVKAAE